MHVGTFWSMAVFFEEPGLRPGRVFLDLRMFCTSDKLLHADVTSLQTPPAKQWLSTC